jgi:LacI family transcriptional regulator
LTQQVIAERVGVSRATISAVINDSRYVSPELRDRVLQVIDELDYVPDQVARSLKTNQTMTVGLGLASLASPFSGSLALGVQNVMQRAGWSTIIYYTQEDAEAMREGLRRLQEKRVDGLILAPAANAEGAIADYIRRSGKPVILLDRYFNTGLPVDEVRSDAKHGSDAAVTHLLETGRRRIAIVNLPEPLSSTRDRMAGYIAAHERFGLPIDPALIHPVGFLESDGYETATMLLKQNALCPDAFFVCSHLMTVGVLKAIRTLGLAIPNDVAVIGFDDMPWAPLMDPPLTVVSQQPYELGATAARLLIERLRGEAPATFRHIQFDTTLIHRASCCSARAR